MQHFRRVKVGRAGQTRLLRLQRLLVQQLLALSAQEFRRRSDHRQTGHWIGQKWEEVKPDLIDQTPRACVGDD